MQRLAPLLLPLLSSIALLLLIEWLKRAAVLPVFVPAPSEVIGLVAASPSLVVRNLVPTLRNAASAYGIAACVTLVAAAIAVTWRVFHRPIYTTGVVINAIPVIASAPLLAVWLGTGSRTQVLIAVLTSQFPMLVGAMQGLSSVDARQRELLHTLSASPRQVFWYLRLPTALPYLFAGLKVAAPLAVLGTVTAEWAGADTGIGAMMLYALFSYDIQKVWLAVLLCCALAAGAYALIAAVERIVVRWDPGTSR